mgnify:CR=1 FL=1
MSRNRTVITPQGNSVSKALRELFQNPDLLWTFTYRDIRVRYAQTYLGLAWSLIQPLFGLAAVFVLFFKIAGVQTGEIPYLSFALSGLIFWNYFSYVVTQSSASLVNVQTMIKKIYFPRLALPIGKSFVGLIDFGVALLLLFIVNLVLGQPLAGLLFFPLILLLTALTAVGIGMIISSVSLRYRDLQQIIPFALQLLFFITPVAYPQALLSSVIPDEWSWLVYFNPITGFLELFRGLLYGGEISPLVWISVVSAVIIFVAGVLFFIRTDKKMADHI